MKFERKVSMSHEYIHAKQFLAGVFYDPPSKTNHGPIFEGYAQPVMTYLGEAQYGKTGKKRILKRN